MDTKPLTSDSLLDYNEYFTNCKADIDILDDFFYISMTTIHLAVNNSFQENIRDTIKHADFESDEEIKHFVDKHMEFINSTVSFYESLETISSNDEIDELISKLYYTFLDIYGKNFKEFTKRIRTNTLHTINVILDKYQINLGEEISNDEFMSEIEKKIPGNYSTLILALFSMIDNIERKPESIDKLSIKTLFSIILVFIFNMNLERKKEESQKNNGNKQYTGVGKNDTCSCGSKLKFKECCLQKLN